MTLQNAINASEYSTATIEYNGMYTTVDGSTLDGSFHISTGVQGMPATDYQQVNGLISAEQAIQDKGLGSLLESEDWMSVGEEGKVQS